MVRSGMSRCIYLSDDVSQAGVTQQQPAPRRDAVGFVLELFWIHLVEIFKPEDRKPLVIVSHVTQEELALIGRPPHSHAVLQDVGVDLSDTIDGVRSDHAQVSHVDPLGVALLDQRHSPQTVRVTREHGRNRLGDAQTDQ